MNSGQVYISKSFSEGDIDAHEKGGGIVGAEPGQGSGSVVIRECFSLGNIGGRWSGGITGHNVAIHDGFVNVTNCYAKGDILGKHSGGICGKKTGRDGGHISILSSYFGGRVGVNRSGGIFGTILDNNKRVEVRYSVYPAPIAGENGDAITLAEGNSDHVSAIQGELYHHHGIREWSAEVWAINRTGQLPVLRWQLEELAANPDRSSNPSSTHSARPSPSTNASAIHPASTFSGFTSTRRILPAQRAERAVNCKQQKSGSLGRENG
eukprot:gb/GECG01006460.1/.p1 GENE.gb/GECG01006460.1/~~gb/GECG01006460.1/.p1  ORF type:complete len:266 (+),score=22.62 gb/GECG01006460.1/:1-798(+)